MKKLALVSILLITVCLIHAQTTKISGKLTQFSGIDSITFLSFKNAEPIEKRYAIHSDGKFAFDYNSTTEDICKLYINQEDFIIIIPKPGEKINITAQATNISQTYTITGSKNSEDINSTILKMVSYSKEIEDYQVEYQRKIDSLNTEKLVYLANTIRKDPYSLSGLVFIDLLDFESFSDVYILLDSCLYSKYPEHPQVKILHQNVQTNMQSGYQIGEIILNDVNGNPVALSSLRGKIVLIDFWATWCGPCRAEMQNIEKAYAKYHSKGFEVYSISIDRDKEAWVSFVHSKQLPWIFVYDEEKKYSTEYQVRSIPFTLLIDQNGKVIMKNVRGEMLEKLLAERLR